MNKTYPVTPAEMDSFRAILTQDGVTVPAGNEGQIVTHGVTMAFSYDGTAGLTLTIVSKPFYVPASMIWSEIQGYLPS
jgi:hypothetical protein